MTVFPGQIFWVGILVVDEYDNPINEVVVRGTQNNTDDYRINHDVIITGSSYRNFTFLVLVGN